MDFRTFCSISKTLFCPPKHSFDINSSIFKENSAWTRTSSIWRNWDTVLEDGFLKELRQKNVFCLAKTCFEGPKKYFEVFWRFGWICPNSPFGLDGEKVWHKEKELFLTKFHFFFFVRWGKESIKIFYFYTFFYIPHKNTQFKWVIWLEATTLSFFFLRK